MLWDSMLPAIDNRGQRLSGANMIRVVDNVGADNRQVVHWVDTLVLVDMTRKICVNVVLEKKWLRSIANVGLVGSNLRAVHGKVSHSKNPGSGGVVNGSKVLSQPGELLVRLVVLLRTVDLYWVKGLGHLLVE